FTYVDVFEPEMVSMILQFDLASGENRLLAVPIVFQSLVLNDQLAVKEHMDLFPNHHDLKPVPLSNWFVHDLDGIGGVGFVIEQTAGANRAVEPCARGEWVPDLHLRAASQVNPAVTFGWNLPIHVHLEVAVVLHRAKAASFAVEKDLAILHLPVRAHAGIGFLLFLGSFLS